MENNAKLDVQKFYEDNAGLHYLEMRSSGNLRDFGESSETGSFETVGIFEQYVPPQ